MTFKRFILLSLCFGVASFTYGQLKPKKQLIQFSGVIVSGDSLAPVPFTNIIIKDTYRGTMSDFYGFFSFVAQVTDTIEFSCVGFRKSVFIIPDSLTTNRYSLIQVMSTDTVVLPEAVIYPWPTREQFKQAFLTIRVPDDDLERAKKNLRREELLARGEIMLPDGSETYKWQMAQYQSKLYYAGQYPVNNLLNPIAWAQFIRAWKRGDFKRKKKK